jgi:hypothetical protein
MTARSPALMFVKQFAGGHAAVQGFLEKFLEAENPGTTWTATSAEAERVAA